MYQQQTQTQQPNMDLSGIVGGLSGLLGGGKSQQRQPSGSGNTQQTSTPDLGGVTGSIGTAGEQLWGGFRRGDYNSVGNLFGYNLAGYNQDITSLKDVWKGDANSEDWGGLTGAAVGYYFGDAQGADAGRAAGRWLFPAVRDLF